ncbi:MAG: hypothetical protein ABL999_02715 [Pyrinomonadaceae bacterium]
MGIQDITPAELNRGKKLAIGGIATPLTLTGIPAIATLLLVILSSGGPPVAAVIFFVGMIVTALGFISGLIISGVLFGRRAKWTSEMRERIAADGIKAEEIGWFRHELKSNEKRALKAVEARDLLLADAYRETLASRLTATRIVKSSKRELQLARKRQGNLKQLKSSRAEEFQAEIAKDVEKISKINDEAKNMLAEAESRLQMIEAAASRQGGLADSELALKKLSARSSELPLALEAAKMSEEIRLELEKKDLD